MGLFSQGIEAPVIPCKNKPETKYDKKKCKSCKHFAKGCNSVKSTCNNPCFSAIKAVEPLNVACVYYQKRKR